MEQKSLTDFMVEMANMRVSFGEQLKVLQAVANTGDKAKVEEAMIPIRDTLADIDTEIAAAKPLIDRVALVLEHLDTFLADVHRHRVGPGGRSKPGAFLYLPEPMFVAEVTKAAERFAQAVAPMESADERKVGGETSVVYRSTGPRVGPVHHPQG